MFLWRKLASAEWSAIIEAAVVCVREAEGFIQRPGGSRIALEIVCVEQTDARELMKAFGGRIEKLGKDWLVASARAQRLRPVRIGKRLIVAAERTKRFGSVPQLIIPAGAAFVRANM